MSATYFAQNSGGKIYQALIVSLNTGTLYTYNHVAMYFVDTRHFNV